MRFLRKVYRIIAIIVHMTIQAISVLWATRKRKGVTQKERDRIFLDHTQTWARGLLKILNIQLETEGDFSDLNERGGLIISNHQSYLDILVHASVLKLRFTPNTGIRSWPVLGAYVAISNPIWVDRSNPRKALATMLQFRETIQNGCGLIIYPEGTTTRGDVPLLPFKATAFETVCGTDLPVYPILTFFRSSEGDFPVQWYDHSGFGSHLLRVLGNKKTYAKVVRLPPFFHEKDMTRKEMAQLLHTLMDGAYQPMKKQFGGALPPDNPQDGQ